MEIEANSGTGVARWIGNLSLLAALFACLILWSGIVLLLTSPSSPRVSASPAPTLADKDTPVFPRPTTRWQWEGASEARRSLADLLLFWLPIGLGAIACGAGVAALAWGRGQDPEVARRALIALMLGIIPGCLCTLWTLPFLLGMVP